MANAKSNIYPIQLQNAELNLNKYDAEIKQYSGFNKNNAPFVGGCLSNIFTKDEVITGANGENVYIDDNGDIYKVTTEGLFKNEEKVIEYPSTVKFYRRRKVEMPSNVVKVLNESVYITREDDITFPDTHHAPGYLAHWGDGYTAIIGEEYSIMPSFLDISAKDNSVVFSYKRYINRGNTDNNAVDVYFIICPDITDSFYAVISDDTQSFGRVALCLQGDPTQVSQSAWIIDSSHFILALNQESSPGRFSSSTKVIARVIFNGTVFGVTKYGNSQFTLYNSGNFNPISENNYRFYPSKYLTDWYMTNEGLFYFKKTREYVDDDVFDLTDYRSPTSYFFTVFVMKIDFENIGAIPGDIVLLGEKFSAYTLTYGSDFSKVTFRPMKGVYTPHYVFNAGILRLNTVSAPDITPYKNEAYFSISGTFSNSCLSGFTKDGVTYLNEIPSGGVVCKDNFKILINNNNLSGISIADFYIDNYIAHHRDGESFNGVLVEEWNTIQDFLIFNNKLFYKKNGEWYCVSLLAFTRLKSSSVSS